MRPFAVLLVLVALLTMLALEASLAGLVPRAMLIGPAMAAIVALTFMRLSADRGLPKVFALAACFWLAVMIGLGSMDGLTRHDILVGALPP